MASSNNNSIATGWVGWIGFASFLLLFSGFFHVIEGIADLSRDTVFVHASGNVWILDYTKWGWINIIGGILLITAALSLAKGGLWGRVLASLVVVLSMLASAAAIPIYPIWAIIVLVIDAFILFAITIHGSEVKALR